MDTALTTGMFTTNYLSVNPMKKDVVKNQKDVFNNIFQKKLDAKNVDKKEVKKTVDNDKTKETGKTKNVNEKESNKIQDDEESMTAKKAREKVKNKMKEINKNKEDVENAVDESISKLNELLEKLDVDTEDLLNNIDVGENVDAVGPQNVETEKITLNMKETEENIEVNFMDQDANSEFDFDAQNLTEDMSNDKDNLKNNKFKIRDFRNHKMENIADREEFVSEKFSISNENIGISLKTGIVNNVSDMKEKIDVLKQITEQMDVSLFDGKTESVMKLKPDDLGKVTVKISLENGIINAKFLAESEKVKEILESGFNQLKDSLQKQGMMIQEFSVSVDNGNSHERALFEGRRKFFNNRKSEKIEDIVGTNSAQYYEYEKNDVNGLWPDSTISFSA